MDTKSNKFESMYINAEISFNTQQFEAGLQKVDEVFGGINESVLGISTSLTELAGALDGGVWDKIGNAANSTAVFANIGTTINLLAILFLTFGTVIASVLGELALLNVVFGMCVLMTFIIVKGIEMATGVSVNLRGAIVILISLISIWIIMTKLLSISILSVGISILTLPITWIIIGIFAIIAVINHFMGTSISAIGVIVGAFFWLGAMIFNTVVSVINFVIQYFWSFFVEPWIAITEFVLNVFNGGFNSFGEGVKFLLSSIISWFLNLGSIVTKIIDAIFGTDWTAGLNSIKDNILDWGSTENTIHLERSAPTIDFRLDATDSWDSGYNFGAGIGDGIGNFMGAGTQDVPEYSGANDGSLYDGAGLGYCGNADIAYNTGVTANNTTGLSDAVSTSTEDLKYIRELAEMETINKLTTAEIKIDMGGITNNMASGTDVNGVISSLVRGVGEAMEKTAEGVYA